MQFFEVPEAHPGQDGICSDNECPCGYPGATIPRGTGYMYVSKSVVDFRRDALTVKEAAEKMQRMQANSFIIFDQNVVTSTIMCEQGARKRGLDLAVAAADAKYWWETGLVPLRETPLANAPASVQAPVRTTPPPVPMAQPQDRTVPPQMAQKSDGLATASLICGIAGITIVPVIDGMIASITGNKTNSILSLISGLAAIITGHKALSQIKQSNGTLKGKNMAIVGLFLGYLLLASAVIFILLNLLRPAAG